jgi:hypothetical protein
MLKALWGLAPLCHNTVMLALLLVLCSTFSEEISESIAKRSVRARRETVYSMGFLGLFWGLVAMLGIVIFGGQHHLDPASWPTLLPRIGLEVLVTFMISESIILADRSTIGFLRLLPIPLLLLVDVILGYHITPLQITGVLLMFFALTVAFRHNPRGQRGAWLIVLTALLNVVTVSLFKYDITHYNDVAAEQALVLGCIVAFFYIQTRRHRGTSPLRLLFRPVSGTQAVASGLSTILGSFAMALAPASVIIALKRTFALLWAVLFGRTYFHEHSLTRKLSSFGITAVAIVLLVSPYLPNWFAGFK